MTQMQDEHAIHAIVEAMEAAWNAGDAAAFVSHMTDDVDFIDTLGRHHTGRAAVEASYRGAFATIQRGSKARYTVEKLRPLSPETAVVFVQGWPDAEAPSVGRPILTLVKQDGVWRIAVFHNTRTL